MIRATTVVLGLLAVVPAGCSRARPPVEMTEVTGRVTVNGRPADRVIMNLTPLTPGEGREDDCVVENGAYRVKLIAAKYKVGFTPVAGGVVPPKRFRSATGSGLELDGTKSDRCDFDIR